MARKAIMQDQIVKLIVGAGKASPSPPVGPALGSKGVKSMDFCKEFNARTANMVPGTPIPVRVTVRPDRSFHFETRTPTTTWLLFQAAGVNTRKNRQRGAMKPGHETIGEVSLKHIYSIAQLKQTETRMSGLSLEGISDWREDFRYPIMATAFVQGAQRILRDTEDVFAGNGGRFLRKYCRLVALERGSVYTAEPSSDMGCFD